MRAWRLWGIALVVALGAGLGFANAASAKGVLEISNQSGEHLAVGAKVKVRIAAKIASPLMEGGVSHECVAVSGTGTPAPLAVNGSKEDLLGETELLREGGCTGGDHPEEEWMSGEIREITLSAKGKAAFLSAYNQFFLAGLRAQLEWEGGSFSCNYRFEKLKGTFSNAGPALVVTGSSRGRGGGKAGCLKHVNMTYTAELFEAEGAEDPLVPELVL